MAKLLGSITQEAVALPDEKSGIDEFMGSIACGIASITKSDYFMRKSVSAGYRCGTGDGGEYRAGGECAFEVQTVDLRSMSCLIAVVAWRHLSKRRFANNA